MTEQKSIWRWISLVNMACIASVIDAQHYIRFGTVRTWADWQPAEEHPLAVLANLLLDVGSVTGLILIVRDAVIARRERRRK